MSSDMSHGRLQLNWWAPIAASLGAAIGGLTLAGYPVA